MILFNGMLLILVEDFIFFGLGGEIDKVLFGMSWIGEVYVVLIMEQRELVDGFVIGILVLFFVEWGIIEGQFVVDQVNFFFIYFVNQYFFYVEFVDGDMIM